MGYGSRQSYREGKQHDHRRLPSLSRWLGLLLVVVALALLSPLQSSAAQNRVYGLKVRGVISQLTADHILRVVAKAESDREPLVIEFSSPGGVDTAIRRITQSILGARVPIIVYVGSGSDAQALSGAMFILLAANVAAANPDAKIGAALPAGLTDRADQQERAARIAGALQVANTIAETRQRNQQTIADVVKNERVLGAREALSGGLINRVSPDVPALLDQIDGTTVRTAIGSVDLATRDAQIDWISMNWRETFLHAITDPNVAYILFSAGVMLLIIALFVPGRLVAGIPGVLAIIVAFIAFGNLPVSRIGLGLLILGGILFVAEQFSPRVGIPGTLGVISYLIGSFTLYQPVRQPSPFAPNVRVNPWLVVGTVCFFVVALLLILRAIVRARRTEVEAAAVALIGHEGVVVKPIDPRGEVRVLEQEWMATTEETPIEVGVRVVVRGSDGPVLIVEPHRDDRLTSDPRSARPSEAGGSR